MAHGRVIEYRAVAVGVTVDGGRPIQSISYDVYNTIDWAKSAAERYQCIVNVYVVREMILKKVKPKYKKKVTLLVEEDKKVEKAKMCLICGSFNCPNPGHSEYKGRVKDI